MIRRSRLLILSKLSKWTCVWLLPEMKLSLIICTYNRCENLGLALETLCHLKNPRDIVWELIVVDNNSTDQTRACCDRFQDRLPLRYVFEARQGQSCARNRGIRESNAPIVAFTDDDVDLDQGWLASLCDAVAKHRDADFYGGRILPRWQSPPPQWLVDHSPTSLRG